MNGPGRLRSGDAGFVLVIVLMLLVVLTLLASAAGTAGSRAVASTQEEIDRFQGQLDMASTAETVRYMMVTQRTNLGGLSVVQAPPATAAELDADTDGESALPLGNEIRLDGQPYAGIGNAVFAIQDDAGLLSPNWAQPAMLAAFFASRGAPATQWAELEAKRLDYQDPDSLHRLGGAEAGDYAEAGLPPPSNRTLATPLEFRRILQWSRLLEGMDDAQLLGTLSIERNAVLNVNTAPAGVLALLPGMDRANAERMVALRTLAPFRSTWKLAESFPIPPESVDALTLFSSRSVNLILWDRRLGGHRLVHWTSTPYDLAGIPWRTDYEVSLPNDPQSDRPVAEAPESPLFAPQDPGGTGRQRVATGR